MDILEAFRGASRAKQAGVLLVAGLVVTSATVAGMAATGVLSQPTVESIETEWGTVTDERTDIRTSVVVQNPNPVGVPGVLDISYEAALNDVTLATGERRGVGLSSGRNQIDLDASIPNDRIADWWVTHVNGGEESTLSIRGHVSGPGGLSREISRNQEVRTNLLDGFSGAQRQVVTVRGEEFLVLENRTASWGTADAERTPLTFGTTITNSHDRAVTLDGIKYVVTMNDVTVGEGTATDGVSVAPGETERIEATAAIDTPKMADWWATHVRNGESSNISVQMYGFVEEDGERKRVPLDLVDRNLALETDLLGGGTTQVSQLPSGDESGGVAPIEVAGSDSRWGEVSDDTTPIRNTITLDNPNGPAVNDLLSMTVGQTIHINDVPVAADNGTFEEIPSGQSDFGYAVEMDNSKVPQWWARHVNQGERSTVQVRQYAAVDAGFTTFERDPTVRNSSMQTDMLAGIESDRNRPIESNGRTVAVIRSQSAEWQEATAQESPFVVDVKIENTGPVPITVGDLDYNVTMNGVVVGEGTAPESHTIQPGQTETVPFTLVIDSQKMDEWWVSHVRNDERTTIRFDAVATVSARGESEQVRLTDDEGDTFETNVLARTSSARAGYLAATPA